MGSTYLESYGSAYWIRTDENVYARAGLSNPFTVKTTRLRLTGHGSARLTDVQQIDSEGNLATSVYDVNRSARTATRTETHAGLSGSHMTNFVNGLPRSTTSFDGLTTTIGYDVMLRANTGQDSRSNTTTTAFVTGTMRPLTTTDASSAQTVFEYDNLGRLIRRRDPRNHHTRFSYTTRGQLHRQWGDGAYPVEYGYDSTYGDRITMSTYRGGSNWGTVNGDGGNAANPWPTSPGTADTTTWAYDGPSGLLTSKTDALGRAVRQTYNVRGQTAVRTLARGVTSTYAYSSTTGEMTGIDYSDTTPDPTFTYTRLGQLDSAADAAGTRDFVYDTSKPWRLSAEALDSFYGSKVMTRLYESSGMVGRIDGFQLGSTAGSNSDLETNFSYTSSGRFETLLSGRNSNATTRTFRYGYLAGSRLIQSLSIDGSHPFTISRSYELTRDLVTSVESKWSTTTRVKYDFTYDERRMRSTLVQSGDVFSDYGDATHRIFTYNGRGELTADVGYMNGTATSQTDPLPGRRYEYAFDQAGNRVTSNRTGVSGMADEYTTNAVNQYVTRENNTLPVSGTANTDSNVAVKGSSTVAGRKGRYWSDDVIVNNAVKPWWGVLAIYTAKPGGGSGGNDLYRSDSRNAWLAAALQSFTYDYDGNVTSDGIWDYGYDAENRLVSMQTTSNAVTYSFPNRVLQFKYDYAGRRIQKRVIDGATSAEISSRRFVYDGWNLIAEYNAPGGTSLGTIVRSYTWGLDIVHSTTSAGGVGALLQIVDHATSKIYLPTYDGNGNVAALLNADNGSTAAIYEYSPYGEPLRAQVNDSTIAEQPFRFSTKFTDVETGLVYYGHRYYEPRNGRFINRDPIEESGGLNLYGFCGNNSVNRWDRLGLEVTVTEHQTFHATAYDAQGNFGEWIFSDATDAARWAAAWESHDRDIVDPYLERMGNAELTASYIAAANMEVTTSEITPEDPNTVEGRPHRTLGVGDGAGGGNATITGVRIYSDTNIAFGSAGFGNGGQSIPIKESQNSKRPASGGVNIGPISIQLSDGTYAPLGSPAATNFAAAGPNTVSMAQTPFPTNNTGGTVIVVTPGGNALPVPAGGTLTGSPGGNYIQVRNPDGSQSGTRIDGGHNPVSHPDPRAQAPHAHVPGVTNPDGTPWLPVKPEPAPLLTGRQVAGGVAAVGTGYLIYRGARMLPSLFPPLWWTLPANAATP